MMTFAGAIPCMPPNSLFSNLETFEDKAIQNILTFYVPASGSKIINITTEYNYSFLLVGTGFARVDLNQVMYLISGYASASRGAATAIVPNLFISVDMSSTDKKITVSNSNTNEGIWLSIIPLRSDISFSVT